MLPDSANDSACDNVNITCKQHVVWCPNLRKRFTSLRPLLTPTWESGHTPDQDVSSLFLMHGESAAFDRRHSRIEHDATGH